MHVGETGGIQGLCMSVKEKVYKAWTCPGRWDNGLKNTAWSIFCIFIFNFFSVFKDIFSYLLNHDCLSYC